MPVTPSHEVFTRAPQPVRPHPNGPRQFHAKLAKRALVDEHPRPTTRAANPHQQGTTPRSLARACLRPSDRSRHSAEGIAEARRSPSARSDRPPAGGGAALVARRAMFCGRHRRRSVSDGHRLFGHFAPIEDLRQLPGARHEQRAALPASGPQRRRARPEGGLYATASVLILSTSRSAWRKRAVPARRRCGNRYSRS